VDIKDKSKFNILDFIGSKNMENAIEKKLPDFIIRDGKTIAVILDINEYQEILDILEDIEDIKELAEMRKKTSKFRDLDDFLKEYNHDV